MKKNAILNEKKRKKIAENWYTMRYNELWRREIPKDRSLKNTLSGLSRQKLNCICFTIYVNDTDRMSRRQLVEKLSIEIVRFAQKWMQTIGMEVYNILTQVSRQNGVSTTLDTDDLRMDFLQTAGILFTGLSDGKPGWYMPDEVLAIYRGLSNEAYRQVVSQNEEIGRLTTGLLYYYGCLPQDQLFALVNGYFKGSPLSFEELFGILASIEYWNGQIFVAEDGYFFYFSVPDPKGLLEEIEMHCDLPYRPLSYDEVYAAGEYDLVVDSDEYKEITRILCDELHVDGQKAILMLQETQNRLQNNETVEEIVGIYKINYPAMTDQQSSEVTACLERQRRVTPIWAYKGYAPSVLSPDA